MTEGQPLMRLLQELLERLANGRLVDGFQAPLTRGSAHGEVRVVTRTADPATPLFVVNFQLARVPTTDRERFFRRLLELNATLTGRASFWLSPENLVCFEAGRPIEDLDPGELVDVLVWTADQADAFDDLLFEEFGTEIAL